LSKTTISALADLTLLFAFVLVCAAAAKQIVPYAVCKRNSIFVCRGMFLFFTDWE
jgi:hypothetical protein